MFDNRKYVIINKDEVSSVDFSKVMETSAGTLCYSLDGSKTYVKYEGSQPSFLSGKTELTHSEIIAELANSDWNPDA
tara:strand:- start:215 stop:445 length:231 start_codon:yes stop_codon:yes gene_type:complete